MSTKVTLDPGAPDLAGQVEEHLDGCLERLQRDYVDLAQLHNRIDPTAGKDSRAMSVDQVLGPGGIAEGLEKVRADGRCRAMGFTSLGDVSSILQVVKSGRFDSTQIFYNMINPSAARPMPDAWTGQNLFGLVDACKAQDMGIIGIRVLVGGIIAADMTDRRVSMMTKETDKETEMVKGGAILDELRRMDFLPRGRREKVRELERVVARLEQETGVAASPERVADTLGVTLGEVDEILLSAKSAGCTSLDGEVSNELMGKLSDPRCNDPQGSAESLEMKDLLVAAIDELPEQEQSVITLYYAEELLLREIAGILGVTESRVSQIHTRALFRLNGTLTAAIGSAS